MQKYKDEESATLLHIQLVTQIAKNAIYFLLKFVQTNNVCLHAFKKKYL